MSDNERGNSGEKVHMLKELSESVVGLLTLFMVIFGNKKASEATTPEEERKAVAEHFPKWLGIGHNDEGIWESLRTALTKPARIALDKIMAKLLPDERTAFVINVSTAPRAITTDAEGNDSSVPEFSTKDPRVIFLKNLVRDANMCKTPTDVEMAVNSLRVNRLLEESRISKIQKKGGDVAAKFLGLNNIEDLADPAKVVGAINTNLRPKIQAKRTHVFKRNLVGRLFQI